MSDQVVGVAVLDKRGYPEWPETLHIACKCSDGKVRHCDIPAYTAGQPKVRTHQWLYEVRGDTLHVTPSVNWLNVFHNGGQWSVKFVVFDDAGEFGTPRQQLLALNPGAIP